MYTPPLGVLPSSCSIPPPNQKNGKQVQHGGMVAPSGIAIKEMGDKNEDMVIVVACVTVGY